MTRQLGRRSVPDIFRSAQTYIHERIAHLELNSKFESSKKPVKQWLEKNGKEDADGNIIYEFPRTIHGVDEKDYSGVMLKKSVGEAYFRDAEIKRFLSKKDPELINRVFSTVVTEVMDPNEVYVLQQEEIITEQELRDLLHYPDPKYALWPIEATVSLEDEEE